VVDFLSKWLKKCKFKGGWANRSSAFFSIAAGTPILENLHPMNRIVCLLLACAFWVPFSGHAQGFSSGKVVYEYHLNLRGIPIVRAATLYFTPDRALFFHSRGEGGIVCIDYLGNVGDATMTVKTVNDNSGRTVMDCYNRDSIGDSYYLDMKSGELIVREFVMLLTPFWWKEPLPELEWTVHPEQKRVGSYLCQKAGVHFRGRDYTAWFTPEIPVPFGPWKLGMLPGLILEISDEKEQVRFSAKELDIRADDRYAAYIVPPPSRGSKIITHEEAKTIWEREQLRLFRIANSSQPKEQEMTLERWQFLEEYEH